MVNPGQDGDIENDPTQNPDHGIARINSERAAEVEEIQAIEEEGGFGNLSGLSRDPSVMIDEDGNPATMNEINAQSRRERELGLDIEAQQWEDAETGTGRGRMNPTMPRRESADKEWISIRH